MKKLTSLAIVLVLVGNVAFAGQVDAVAAFSSFLRSEITADQLSEALIQDPSNFDKNIETLQKVVISQNLMNGSTEIKAKLFDSQNSLNKAIKAHNQSVINKRRLYKAGGTVAGVVVGGVIASNVSSGLIRAELTSGIPLIWGILLTVGGGTGYLLGTGVGAAATDPVFDNNSILDNQ